MVELFVDDLIEEQVYVLEEIELAEQLEKEKNKNKTVLNDYQRELEDFVNETEEI